MFQRFRDLKKFEKYWFEGIANSVTHVLLLKRAREKCFQMGNLLSFNCQFFATQNIGGAKELELLL